jgi:hypothetical protein
MKGIHIIHSCILTIMTVGKEAINFNHLMLLILLCLGHLETVQCHSFLAEPVSV